MSRADSGTAASPRAGITLLEVLIAIGILAVGLGSVVSLMPAAQSQANRAVVLDRAAVLAANALADAATWGLFREGGAVLSIAATPGSPVVVDPAASTSYLAGTQLAQASAAGVAAPPGAAAPASVLRLLTELRDDLTVGDPPTPDDLPLNAVVDGARGYLGRMTCFLSIKPGGSSGVPGTASVVVFHGRNTASPLAITGTLENLRLDAASLDATQLDGRRMREVLRPGTVLWDPAGGGFHQVSAAAFDTSGASAFLTLHSGATLASGTFTVQVLPDAVGLAERPYVPESTSEFTR